MSLNPSCNLEGARIGFKRIGDPPFSEEGKNCAVSELESVGFHRGSIILTSREHQVYKKDSEVYRLARQGIHIPLMMQKESDLEWVNLYSVKAEFLDWKFERAWYYWIAEAAYSDSKISVENARTFNDDLDNRKEVRVEGFAGGQDVRNPVKVYHIDTPRGLRAFVDLLKKCGFGK